jgi:CcmD family protein
VSAEIDGADMDNLNFLFAAYTAVWVLLFLYILSLSRRNRSLDKEIEELRELLQRRQQP